MRSRGVGEAAPQQENDSDRREQTARKVRSEVIHALGGEGHGARHEQTEPPRASPLPDGQEIDEADQDHDQQAIAEGGGPVPYAEHGKAGRREKRRPRRVWWSVEVARGKPPQAIGADLLESVEPIEEVHDVVVLRVHREAAKMHGQLDDEHGENHCDRDPPREPGPEPCSAQWNALVTPVLLDASCHAPTLTRRGARVDRQTRRRRSRSFLTCSIDHVFPPPPTGLSTRETSEIRAAGRPRCAPPLRAYRRSWASRNPCDRSDTGRRQGCSRA